MTEMDREQKKKLHKVGVICAEVIMVVSVIAIVIVTVMISLGYKLDGEGGVEQSGLMQLHTIPSGATVEIDGETMFARTDMSRSLSQGSHHVKASREGYDTWEKNVKIEPGLLLRVYYPRLFLQERKAVEVANLGVGLEFYSVAPNRKSVLWASPDASVWKWGDVTGDEMVVREINVAEVFGLTDATVFPGVIQQITWSSSGDRVLMRVAMGEATNWYLINLRDVSKSRNLSADFGLNFSEVKIMDDAADKLWTLENGNLRLANASSRELSRILVNQVGGFDNVGGSVVYVRDEEGGMKKVGTYREGEQDKVELFDLKGEVATKVWISRYYNEDYLVVVEGQKMTVYEGRVPNYSEGQKVKTEDYLKVFVEEELKWAPEKLAGNLGGEYVVAQNGGEMAVLDLEQKDLYEYEVGAGVRWLDDSMFYEVSDKGELVVWDFDNTNRRTLATGVAPQEVVITNNNKYLYYMRLSGEDLVLMKEQII